MRVKNYQKKSDIIYAWSLLQYHHLKDELSIPTKAFTLLWFKPETSWLLIFVLFLGLAYISFFKLIRISHAEVPWNFVDWHDWTEMAINNIITFFFFFDMLLLGTGQGTYYCVHDIGQGHKKQYLYVLLQAVSVVSGTFWKGFLGGQLVVYILVYGGFHLHLLIFP